VLLKSTAAQVIISNEEEEQKQYLERIENSQD
jgi:hypothetical protein